MGETGGLLVITKMIIGGHCMLPGANERRMVMWHVVGGWWFFCGLMDRGGGGLASDGSRDNFDH